MINKPTRHLRIMTMKQGSWLAQCLGQGLGENLETGCLKLTIIKFWGVPFFKGDNNFSRISESGSRASES